MAEGTISGIGLELTLDTSQFDAAIERSESRLNALGARGGGTITMPMGRGGGQAGSVYFPGGAGGGGTRGGPATGLTPTFTAGQASIRQLRSQLRSAFAAEPIPLTFSLGRNRWSQLRNEISAAIGPVPISVTYGGGKGGTMDVVTSIVAQSQGISTVDARRQIRSSMAAVGVQPSALVEKRAAGGPVQPNKPYLVGERGPELFTTRVPGQISPADNVARLRKEYELLTRAMGGYARASSGVRARGDWGLTRAGYMGPTTSFAGGFHIGGRYSSSPITSMQYRINRDFAGGPMGREHIGPELRAARAIKDDDYWRQIMTRRRQPEGWDWPTNYGPTKPRTLAAGGFIRAQRGAYTRADFPGVYENLRKVLDRGTPEQFSFGRLWYPTEGQRLATAAQQRELTPAALAAIVAKFSQNSQWPANLKHATSFVDQLQRGLPDEEMRVFATMAARAQARLVATGRMDPFDILKGPKETPFAHALLGNVKAVPVDRWMNRAGGYPFNLRTGKPENVAKGPLRELITEGVTRLADERGEVPSGMQAIIWDIIGGGRDPRTGLRRQRGGRVGGIMSAKDARVRSSKTSLNAILQNADYKNRLGGLSAFSADSSWLLDLAEGRVSEPEDTDYFDAMARARGHFARGGFLRSAYEQTLANSGGTFDRFGRQPSRGYAVALGQGPIVPADDPVAFAKAFRQVYKAGKKTGRTPFVGTWRPEGSNEIQIDMATVLGRKRDAMRAALQEAQIAGFDLKRFEEIFPRWNSRYPSPGQMKLGMAKGGYVEQLQRLFPSAKIDLRHLAGRDIREIVELSERMADEFPFTAAGLRGIQSGGLSMRRRAGARRLGQTETGSLWNHLKGIDGKSEGEASRIILASGLSRPDWRRAEESSPELATPSPRGVFAHEFGHAVDFAHHTQPRYGWVGHPDMPDAFVQHPNRVPEASRYAASSPAERFAEAFSAWALPKDTKGDYRALEAGTSIDPILKYWSQRERGLVGRAQGGPAKKGGLPRGYTMEFLTPENPDVDQSQFIWARGNVDLFGKKIRKPSEMGTARTWAKTQMPMLTAVVRDRQGNIVANAPFTLASGRRGDEPYLHPELTEVSPEHSGKGLATAMYVKAERFTGRQVRPAIGDQTQAGISLWLQKERPFGRRYEDEVSRILPSSLLYDLWREGPIKEYRGRIPKHWQTSRPDLPEFTPEEYRAVKRMRAVDRLRQMRAARQQEVGETVIRLNASGRTVSAPVGDINARGRDYGRWVQRFRERSGLTFETDDPLPRREAGGPAYSKRLRQLRRLKAGYGTPEERLALYRQFGDVGLADFEIDNAISILMHEIRNPRAGSDEGIASALAGLPKVMKEPGMSRRFFDKELIKRTTNWPRREDFNVWRQAMAPVGYDWSNERNRFVSDMSQPWRAGLLHPRALTSGLMGSGARYGPSDWSRNARGGFVHPVWWPGLGWEELRGEAWRDSRLRNAIQIPGAGPGGYRGPYEDRSMFAISKQYGRARFSEPGWNVSFRDLPEFSKNATGGAVKPISYGAGFAHAAAGMSPSGRLWVDRSFMEGIESPVGSQIVKELEARAMEFDLPGLLNVKAAKMQPGYQAMTSATDMVYNTRELTKNALHRLAKKEREDPWFFGATDPETIPTMLARHEFGHSAHIMTGGPGVAFFADLLQQYGADRLAMASPSKYAKMDIEDLQAYQTAGAKMFNVPGMEWMAEMFSVAKTTGRDPFKVFEFLKTQPKVSSGVIANTAIWNAYDDLYKAGRFSAHGSRTDGGPYIVNENGPELFVPSRLEHMIPPDVMAQIPQRRDGGMVEMNQRPWSLFNPPEDGWIIPNHLKNKVPRAQTGVPPATSPRPENVRKLYEVSLRTLDPDRIREKVEGVDALIQNVREDAAGFQQLMTQGRTLSSVFTAMSAFPARRGQFQKKMAFDVATRRFAEAAPAAAAAGAAIDDLTKARDSAATEAAEAKRRHKTYQHLNRTVEEYDAAIAKHKETIKRGDEATAALAEASEALKPGISDLTKNVLSVGAGMFGYQAAMSGLHLVTSALTPVMDRMIDASMGYANTESRVTIGLAGQLRQMGGNVGGVFGQAALSAGIGGQFGETIQRLLTPSVVAKAGAMAQAEASDLYRSALHALAGGAPEGLFGGYGGIGGGSIGAGVLGGGPGFTEQFAKDLMAQTGQEAAFRAKATEVYGPDLGPIFGMANAQNDWFRDVLLPDLAGGAAAMQPSAGFEELRTKYVDNFNAALDRGAKAAGETATGFELVKTESQALKDEFIAAGKAAGDEDSARKMAAEGYVLATSQLEAGAAITEEQYRQTFQQGARGLAIGTPEAFARASERQLLASKEMSKATGELERTLLQPFDFAAQMFQNPVVAGQARAPLAGLDGVSLRQVFGAGGGGFAAGLQARLDTVQSNSQARMDQAFVDVERMAKEISTQISPQAAADFRMAMTGTGGVLELGRQITEKQVQITKLQSGLRFAEIANNLRIAGRSLGDALGLAGRAGGSRFGGLQREQTMLGFELQRRDINLERAVAGFQVAGETPEERAARQEIAVAKTDISSRLLTIAEQTFAITANRGVTDASATVRLLHQSQRVEAEITTINAEIADKQAEQARKWATASSFVQQAGKNINAELSTASSYVERFGGTIEAARLKIRSVLGLGSSLGTNTSIPDERRPSTGGSTTKSGVEDHFNYGKQVTPGGSLRAGTTLTTEQAYYELQSGRDMNNNGRLGYATGGLFNTTRPTDLTVGEANTETVAILRNPRRMLAPGLSGSGPINITINIPGVTVREASQIDDLARRIEERLANRLQMVRR